MPPLPIYLMDMLGVAVFAATGALVASRKQMDLIGFALLATVTGVGGGTLRDLLLSRQAFWIADQTYLAVCLAIAVIVYFTAHLLQRRYIALLWMDAVGLAAYGVLGAHIALTAGAGPLIAAALGVMTATFGGMIRDLISQEPPLILKQELYATAALAAALAYLLAIGLGAPTPAAALAGIAAGFALRAGAIARGWQLPRYKPREGRKP
ncbi:MAG: trimeric intracellular cation channel family protein [Pseudomonadota bacterium]|nr:trimeric intracellular cation channel family protein [Pseudomonadota bacterium]